MRFAIRDDDTNFYTDPARLEQCYSGIWQTVPPTLCVISKVKGNWLYWVHQIYKDKQKTDWQAWRRDSEIHPIEENEALVSFIREKIKEGKVDIGFHAKHHRNEDPVMPEEQQHNYVFGAEFYTSRDLTTDIREEVAYLNLLFNTDISVFTPPQNLLSLKGYQAVLNAGLNICGGGISFYKKQKDISGIINIIKQLWFKAGHKGHDYPFVLHYKDHTEIPCHYPLQPNTPLQTLIDQFEKVRSFDGDFVLSTHYIEFDYPMVYDHRITMKNTLESFLNYISRYPVVYTSLSEMLNPKSLS